jgi:hypothetical protein
MSKKVAFIALSLLGVVVAVLGYQLEAAFLSDLWSQLFWLVAATLATTFVLEALLQRDAQVRQRSGDAFAFRSFAANLMNAIQEIAGLEPKNEKLFEAALSGDKQFEAAMAEVGSLIEKSEGFEPSKYARYYLDVASGLRDLSKNFIRLFSTTRREMLAQYQELNELANHWDYKDEFSERSQEYTASLKADNPDRAAREATLRRQISSVRDLVAKTATRLVKLAAKNATGKNMYGKD